MVKSHNILKSRRYIGRLSAVQALYQNEIQSQNFNDLICEFLSYRKSLQADEKFAPNFSKYFDQQLFEDVVRGVIQQQESIDQLIRKTLDLKIKFDRLELLIRSILRASTFELMSYTHLPIPIILNEYVTIARSFFVEREPEMINGILDTLAHQYLRVGQQKNQNLLVSKTS